MTTDRARGLWRRLAPRPGGRTPSPEQPPARRAKQHVRLELGADELVVGGRYSRDRWHVARVTAEVRQNGAKFVAPAEGDADFHAVLPLDDIRAAADGQPSVVDLWLELAPRDAQEPADGDATRVRLGKFRTTERVLSPQYDGRGAGDVRLSVTDRDNISLSLEGVAGRRFRLTVSSLEIRGDRLEADLQVRCGDRPARTVRVVAIGRESGNRYVAETPTTVRQDLMRREGGRYVQEARAHVSLSEVADALADGDETVDLFVEVEDHDGSVQRIRLRAPGHVRELQTGIVRAPGEVVQFVPYETFRAANLSIHVERFGAAEFGYLQRMLGIAWLLPLVRPFLGVWLIGELPYKAQDNGYYFFRWIRRNRPRRRAYFVITADSPDRARVERWGNVVTRGSREHIRAALLARRIVSTHHAEYLLPSRQHRAVRAASGIRVFLQHGVLATKNMAANYGRQAPGFHTDRFHVSSDREKRIVVEDLGFRPGQVRVTGMPRIDSLLEAPGDDPQGILVIPTWREWISSRSAFLRSDYRQRWLDFLTHDSMRKVIDEGVPVTFIQHPNMRRYADLMEVPGVRVLRQGEHDVQGLLKAHRCLVTDYSSVALDFALLRRPVFYFHFDRERFNGDRPPHLDLDRDLPGLLSSDAAELAAEVSDAAMSARPMDAESWSRVQRLYKHVDRRNCERVERSVRGAGGPWAWWWRRQDAEDVREEAASE